ncbi:MAG TPA: hypothetical protein VHS96_01740, partial [Bacteroidia bacterium]|nr:hypothetical protein [Bacteroidia bacterium]
WGSTTAIPRKQFIQELAFKLLGIPYLQKLKIVHRPNMDWLAVSPDEMVMSHLPIDPKWQLRDSAVSIAEFEAVRDTFIPAIPNEFLIAIAATRGQIEPIQEWVEGKNGKQFNARDDFDLARGWIRKGHEALLLPPEAGGDTITWLRGISDMKESTPALAAWMKELATENRLRGRELAILSNLVRRSLAKVQTDVNRVRAEHRRMEHFVNVIDYQQANEQRLLQKMRASFSGIGRGPAGIPKPPKPRVMENLRAKYETSLYRADSLTGLAMKTTMQMLSLSDTIERLQDSLQDSRGNATTQLNICLRLLMQGWEVRYGWALMRLDSIGDRLQGQSKQWQKAKNRYWTVYKASRVKWLSPARQLERAHGLICQMHRSGAPVQMLMGLRDSFQLQFDTFRKLRIEQMQIPRSEGDLQLGHLVQSEAVYGKTDRDIRRQNKLAGKYIAQERRRQANWHRGEQALASHLRHSARIGAGRLGGWVNKARAEAKRALASRK